MKSKTARIVAALYVVCLAAPAPSAPAQEGDERARIEAALPARAQVRPRKPRKLLIFDLNVGYPGHPSIKTANLAFELMGKKTGAFDVVVSRDPAVFEAESLRQFDAVFFNNTVGNQFTDPALRRNLAEFVVAGGGLMGVHGATVGFTRWPGAIEDWQEFGLMIGGRGAAHADAEEKVYLRNEDPDHPLAQVFGGKGFEHADEFFRVGDPYARSRQRVLLSIDNEKTARLQGKDRVQRFREDDDYALSWIKQYGRGRVFYSTMGHQPRDFWDPRLLRYYLAAAQYVLGDLDAPATPSALLTPAMRAQERLGLRLGLEAYTFHRISLVEMMDRASELGLAYIGGLSFQRVAPDIPKNLDPSLTDSEIEYVRMKLASAGLRMLTYFIQDIPGDEDGCRRVFDFARRLGVETLMTEPKLEALDMVERYADRYDIKVALHNHDRNASPNYWSPEAILKVCKGRSKRIGACADIGYWIRDGIDPVAGVRKLGSRLITLQLHDLNERSPKGRDVPWGSGKGETEKLIRTIQRLRHLPTMVGLEYSDKFEDNTPEVRACIAFFNDLSLRMAGRR